MDADLWLIFKTGQFALKALNYDGSEVGFSIMALNQSILQVGIFLSIYMYLFKYIHYSIVTNLENYIQNDMPSCTC